MCRCIIDWIFGRGWLAVGSRGIYGGIGVYFWGGVGGIRSRSEIF
jgi:hypothetical protein